MESLAKLHYRHQPFTLSLNPHRTSFPKPIFSFRPPTSSSPPFNFNFSSLTIKASSSPRQTAQNPKPSPPQILTPFLKTTCAAIAASAFFLFRLQPLPAIASPSPPPPATVERTEKESSSLSYEEKQRLIEEKLDQNPDDVETLRSLIEERIKAQKLNEAVEVLDRLIKLEPEDFEWQLLKANVHSYMGELELATTEFECILEKDPFRVEAYHGLVMSASQQSPAELKSVMKRVEEAIEKCKKQGNKSDVRDFKLLFAQIRVMESNYSDALKLYQELVREEPRDFRPYLCQGIIYTMLRKNNEAEKQFEKFRKLVPKSHPYKEYFDDNMFATKLFGQKVERERAGSSV